MVTTQLSYWYTILQMVRINIIKLTLAIFTTWHRIKSLSEQVQYQWHIWHLYLGNLADVLIQSAYKSYTKQLTWQLFHGVNKQFGYCCIWLIQQHSRASTLWDMQYLNYDFFSAVTYCTNDVRMDLADMPRTELKLESECAWEWMCLSSLFRLFQQLKQNIKIYM